MLFNSVIYLFQFLPVVFAGFFLLGLARRNWGIGWLVVASLFFYGYWKPAYLWLILLSVAGNYGLGILIAPTGRRSAWLSKVGLMLGVSVNLGMLGYYKYVDFLIENVNTAFGASFSLPHIFLPLAISFFTFQQIAFLVDSYRGEQIEGGFGNYALFVCFFPQLIAGPIVHHREMMPQFADPSQKRIQWNNIATGFFTLSIGLFKKVCIADSFSVWATYGFDQADSLSFFPAWFTALSYTLQLYFDFSGYTDMAIGSALLFNIQLPINFSSPYKARNIQDFWRRWHMTLSRFLRDYLYIPLGGNREGEVRMYRNIFITFLLGGIWHGAGWTFVIWGAINGLGIVFFILWSRRGIKLPGIIAWGIHFVFINICWVFFRAENFGSAIKVLRGMFGFEGVILPKNASSLGRLLEPLGVRVAPIFDGFRDHYWMIAMIPIFLAVTVFCPNSNELRERFRPSWKNAAFASALLILALTSLHRNSEFLYFQF